MKKMLFMLLLTGLCAISYNSFAAWQYCRHSVQTTSDTWDVFIVKTWTGGGMGANPKVQYRYSYFDQNQNLQTTAWAPIPSSGYIGSTGLGGSLFDIEVRELSWFDPAAPPLFQALIGSC